MLNIFSFKSIKNLIGLGFLVVGYLPLYFLSNQSSQISNETTNAYDIMNHDLLTHYQKQNKTKYSDMMAMLCKQNCQKIISQQNALKSFLYKNKVPKNIKLDENTIAKAVKGTITSNFYSDAIAEGIPAKVVIEVSRLMKNRIDFKKNLKPKDKFEIMYNAKNELLYANIITKRGNVSLYRVNLKNDNKYAYYYGNGEQLHTSIAGDSFGSPLAGRISVSSPFGRRIHPINKTVHNHSGVDLKAKHGDPVMAVYSGTITRSSYAGGYGNCIDIKHKNGFMSRYAHLSKCYVKKGDVVCKGEKIGAVGSTGRSTGAHLHLELARHNKLMNPISLKMMPSQTKPLNNSNFIATKKKIDKLIELI